MDDDRSIELEELDACLILQADGSIGLILPHMDEDDLVPTNVQVLMGIMIRLQKSEFHIEMAELFCDNATNINKILGERLH